MPNFNANIYGDMIVDTHVAYSFSDLHFDNNCNYIGGAVDCLGIPIVTTTLPNGYVVVPSRNNFMFTENTNLTCPAFFTPGQGIRMREAILGYFSSSFSSWMNTIESLYEPFDRIDVLGDVISITDNLNGTARVCRSLYQHFRFQPGFDYTFPDNQSPDILTASVNDVPFINQPPFNCPVIIQQLGFGQNGQALTLDKAFICTDEPYIKGTLFSTAILGSMNITIQELTRLQVNDPALYDNLLEQYYYILKKETESGAIKETVIFKQ